MNLRSALRFYSSYSVLNGAIFVQLDIANDWACCGGNFYVCELAQAMGVK